MAELRGLRIRPFQRDDDISKERTMLEVNVGYRPAQNAEENDLRLLRVQVRAEHVLPLGGQVGNRRRRRWRWPIMHVGAGIAADEAEVSLAHAMKQSGRPAAF